MNDKEMIEEMARDVRESLRCNFDKTNLYHYVTKDLYNAGYRKIPDGAVVLTERQHEIAMRNQYDVGFNFGYKKGSKETARNILNDLDAFLYQTAIDYETRGHKDYFAVCEYLAIQIRANIKRQFGVEIEG